MADYNFSDKQITILRCLYIFDLILFILLSSAIIHNSWRFLIKARLGSILVILFYILAGLVSITHLIYFIILVIDPSHSPFLFQPGPSRLLEILEWIGSAAMLAIGWLIATTMFHLMITIQHIFKLISPQRAVRLKYIVSIIAIVLITIEILLMVTIMVFIEVDLRSLFVSDLFIVFYSVLSISYAIIIILLYRTLKQMNEFGDFNQEQLTVIYQFACFFFAYAFKLAIQVFYIVGDNHYDISTFTYAVACVIDHCVVDFFPIAYLVYCHYSTYIKQVDNVLRSTDETTGGANNALLSRQESYSRDSDATPKSEGIIQLEVGYSDALDSTSLMSDDQIEQEDNVGRLTSLK